MRSASGAVGDARQTVEASGVRSHDDAPPSKGSCRDHQVVRSPRLAGTLNVGEKLGVAPGDVEVVVLDRQRVDDRVDELLSRSPALPVGELHPHEQLSDRHGRDGHVVVVRDDLGELRALAFRVDEDRSVEDQAGQDRSSTTSESRISASSLSQALSGLCLASSALSVLPSTLATGSSRATGCPPRRTTNDCPRCSTSSSRSEKPRAASVAEISLTESDYQSVLDADAPSLLGLPDGGHPPLIEAEHLCLSRPYARRRGAA